MDPGIAIDIADTARLLRREMNRRAAELGATRAQWRVLARLYRSGCGQRQVDLAESLDVEPITLSRMLDRLEEAGLIERRRDPEDRRAWRIHLTAKAQPIIDQLSAIGAEFQAELTEGLEPAECRRVSHILAHLRERLAQMESERRTEVARAS
jgi:MarR family transcriptional regulator, transcriptional regulator for hemolysin